jgi:hypothetical protein
MTVTTGLVAFFAAVGGLNPLLAAWLGRDTMAVLPVAPCLSIKDIVVVVAEDIVVVVAEVAPASYPAVSLVERHPVLLAAALLAAVLAAGSLNHAAGVVCHPGHTDIDLFPR